MTRRDVIVLGASAGGVEALRAVVAGLPSGLRAAVLVVLHVPSYGASELPQVLDRSGPLPARQLVSGEPLPHGTVLVAPADHHLVVDDGRVRLTRGPHENGYRPAIDVLFRSAARWGGNRVVGAVLSGVLDDGTAGLSAIKRRGGLAFAQDPDDALYAHMPASAIAGVAVDHVAPAAALGALLAQACAEEIAESGPAMPGELDIETDMALLEEDAMNMSDRPGRPSGFSCPDCNGVLWEIDDGSLVRYRCRVGHAWSPDSLLGEQAQQLDTALWMALRGLEEKAALARTLEDRALERNSHMTATRYAEQATAALHAANLIRTMLEAHVGAAEQPDLRA